jgi:uncharacterized membrane protein YphA (DoxX/SURF4 family)
MDRCARLVLAAVWLYNGLWCKLLAGSASHRDIVAAAAEPLGLPTLPVLWALGGAEVAMALWVLAGKRRRLAAWVQTLAIVGMNGAGLLSAADEIPDAGALLAQNAVFLTLAWIVGLDRLRGSAAHGE